MISKIQSDPSTLGNSVFSNGLGKYAICLCRKTLPFGSEFLAGSRDVIENSIRPFSIGLRDFSSSNGLGKYAIWVYGEKYLYIAIWFRKPPRFRRCYLKFNPTLLHWTTAFFSSNGLRIYIIWVYVDKYLNIAKLLKFPPGSRNDIANSIRPFSVGLRDFFQKWFSGFLKSFPRIFKGLFFTS